MPSDHATCARRAKLALAALLAVALACAGPAAAAKAKTEPAPKIYKIKTGAPLRSLPGSSLLMPKRAVTSLTLSMMPVTYQLLMKNKTVIFEFTTPSFVAKGKPPMAFAPTMRLKRGQSFSVSLTNMMIDPNDPVPDPAPADDPPFYGPMDTNLHTHGVFTSNGVPDQGTAYTYKGGDNVFVRVRARTSADQAGNVLEFRGNVSSNQLPGLHWLHPHKHGSTTIQTSTAHGSMLVEDDFDAWMPTGTGCDAIKQVLSAAEDIILDITLVFFKYAAAPIEANWKTLIDDANLQIASNISGNPYCCAKPATNGHPFKGTATGDVAAGDMGTNLYLVNGGYMPEISLQQDTWARIRLLYSGAKGFIAIAISKPGSANATTECDLRLVSKDGIYMPLIPRKIDGMVHAAGGRIEVLVKCSGARNTQYVLTAGQAAVGVFSDNAFSGNPYLLQQEVLATIKMKGPGNKALKGDITDEACKPKRPSYAADLRDAALAAAGYNLSNVVVDDVQFTFDRQYACEVNGQVFKFPDPAPLVLPLGKIVQWSFNDPNYHPLHVHTNPFQLVFINHTLFPIADGNRPTNFYKEGDYYDNFLYPFNPAPNPGSFQLRFQPGPYSGYTVMHCHYLQHEDAGCMKVILYKCPGYGDVQPADGQCPGFTYPVPGTFAA